MAKLQDLAHLVLDGVLVRRRAWSPDVGMTFLAGAGTLRRGMLTLLTPAGPHRYLPHTIDVRATDWEVLTNGTPQDAPTGRGLPR